MVPHRDFQDRSPGHQHHQLTPGPMHPLAFDPVDGTPIKGITKIPDWARVPEGWVDSPEEAAKPVPPRDYKWLKGKVAVVTGGGGFVGRNIGLDLLSIAKCKTVKLVDLREPQAWNGRDEEAKKATKAGRLQFVKVGRKHLVSLGHSRDF